MKQAKKSLDKKIRPMIFFSIVIIFSFFIILSLANIFISQSSPNRSTISKDTGQVSKQEILKSQVNKDTSSSAVIPQNYIPPVQGNQLTVPVLYYHYVGNNPNIADLQRDALSISPDKFDEQMKYLKDNGYVTISYDTLYAALKKQTTLPNKAVILTFDDGYIDFYYNAYNILRQYGLSATVFVPTGLIGQPAYLTWPMIKEMHTSGVINFGAHTVHHYHLVPLSSDAASSELMESKKLLQDELGIPINFMAYPYGETNLTIVSLVQKVGYMGAIGTWSGKIQSEGTVYNSPRLRIGGSISIESFAALLQ